MGAWRYTLFPAIAGLWSLGCAAGIVSSDRGFEGVAVIMVFMIGNVVIAVAGMIYAICCRLQDSSFRVFRAIGLVMLSAILAYVFLCAISHIFMNRSEYDLPQRSAH